MASISARLSRIKDEPGSLIDHHVVERACEAVGYRWRERTLGPRRTLQAFAAQIAHGNTAITHVVRLTGGVFNESAYCQARNRLPVPVVRAVFEDFTGRLQHHGRPDQGLWRGHRVVLIDGTGVSLPDTPELREFFGFSGSCPGGCGLPLAKVLAVFDAHDGLLLDLHVGTAGVGDLRHAHDLHPALRRGDIEVGDRGLCAYTHLAMLRQIGCHGVFRMRHRTMPFPARRGERRRRPNSRHRRHEPILVELITKDDQVVEIVKPSNRPKHLTPEQFASIPGKMVVRAMRYQVQGRGMRTREITLLTTLLDARKYPARAVADLYLARWRIEINLRHLKRTLGMNRLKCHSVDGVRRELFMFALIYNAVCHTRARAAHLQAVEPWRLSFVDTLRCLLLHRPGCPTLPVHTPTLKAWPKRPARIHPRALKQGRTTFLVMCRPRAQLIRELINEHAGAN